MHITVEHTISMGHRLPSYKGICNSLHGHNVRVEVSATLGEQFLDFKHVADLLKEVLEPLDHAMVLYEHDPVIRAIAQVLPGQRFVLLSHEPSTENVAAYVFMKMSLAVQVERVTVHETAKYSATHTLRQGEKIPEVRVVQRATV